MKQAFTLSEILITIAIVGVVAAMTIPNVITNYQKKQTALELKKVYNEILQINNRGTLEYGDPSGWEYPGQYDTPGTKLFLEKYYIPYIKNSRYISSDELHHTKNYKIKNLNNGAIANTNGGLFLNNDKLLTFFAHGDYIWILADLNGLKEPNRAGRDIFVFYQYCPYSYCGASYIPHTLRSFSCSKKASDTYNGFGCAHKIQKDGWEIKSDYPW